MSQLVPLIQNSSTKAKIGLAAGTLITIVVLFMLFKMATAPSYSTLVSGAEPSETGKITAALDEKGIAYKIENGGTAIAVLPADTATARIALAEQGLTGAKGQPGFELFDKQKMGTSDFQQQVNYQRALEGEIANTIEQVDGVNGAKVQLVMPEDALFAEDKKPATAAVLLSGSSSAIDPSSVRGMAQLVSSSVEGLALDKVTITDGSGTMLWPKESGDAGDGATAKLAAEQRYNTNLEAELNALVARTVGADKGTVQVSSQLNVDKINERKLTYGNRTTPLKQQTEEEQLEGTGAAGAAGAAGTATNVPGYTGDAAGGGGESNYERNTENVENGVDKTIRDTTFAQGAVERQSIGVMLDPSVPAATRTQIQQAVASAAGVDAARGDTITTSAVPFAKEETTEQKDPIADYMGYAKWGGLGLATLLFLFFVRRSLKKRESEALGEPVWLREINAPQPLAALEGGMAPTAQLERPRNDIRRRAEEIAAKEPEKVAQQLRAWMAEDA